MTPEIFNCVGDFAGDSLQLAKEAARTDANIIVQAGVVEYAAKEWNSDTVLFLPDQYLAKNVAAMTDIKIVTWAGSCEVHERFTADDIRELREGNPGVIVLAHPECPPDVLAEADFAGSTSGISNYVKENQPDTVVLITECSMSDNVATDNPKVNFVRPCNLCPHMKRISLPKILNSLQTMEHKVEIDPAVMDKARQAIERMIALPLTRQSMYSHERKPEVMAIETRLRLTQSNILIVGAGVAGLYTALKLAPRPVTIITARPLGKGGATPWAQGGLAAAIGEDDTPNLHFADTMQAGAGLVDPEAASVLVDGGAAAVEDLVRLGVEFDADADGVLQLGREAAHCRNRIVHATGDQAGAAIMDVLISAARASNHITILERIVVEDLLVDDNNAVGGALVYDVQADERASVDASETVLATGGLGGLYAVTTNPLPAQGHGLAFAARAGAVIRDPEFVQFHPTALDIGVDPAPLATEALRGDGATLVNEDGRPFMVDYNKAEDLAPRDIVARAVEAEIKAGRGALLDATKAIGKAFPDAYPTVFASCQNAKIDPRTHFIPIAPAAHYHMGGVMTDINGASSAEGLWAVGEVASSGVHGANRLASNSLLEALVFGARIADQLREKETTPRHEPGAPGDRMDLASKPADPIAMMKLRAAMSSGCALIRSADSLHMTLNVIHDLNSDPAMTSGLKSALVTAELIVQGALMREESRGGHYRSDFPDADEEAFHTEICTTGDITSQATIADDAAAKALIVARKAGVASATAELVDAVEGTGAQIVCTRKTTPGLRAFEKYAVRCGGGGNHRFGLYDAVMITDNHIMASGGITNALTRARAGVGHMVKVEIEIDRLDQLDEALAGGADVILLDNMSIDDLTQAVKHNNGKAVLEASGNVTVDTVRAIAETGVDVISSGWITHSAPNLDLGLDFF
ncbi:L-aspartate oxidase (LASPO) (Quinolinate synthase B) [Durusdinium trenchii]|uniref:L-aspartate oxidase (LASPO) (Quinolinate synthase B) n=1 Tax=Durusdinium trenchii TaxID=1381693 RepID=A0ABP0LS71_9DINO